MVHSNHKTASKVMDIGKVAVGRREDNKCGKEKKGWGERLDRMH